MRIKRASVVLLAAAAIGIVASAGARQSQKSTDELQQMGDDMRAMGLGGQRGSGQSHNRNDVRNNLDAAMSANEAMSSHDMHMGPHLFLTALRPGNAADKKRAAEIVSTLRQAIAKYQDYKVALADGFRIFMPNLPQPMYHFTNYGYAYEAEYQFNPAQPTSLLYTKSPDGYKLIGAMYTAPRDSTEAELNERVPLSVARWHKHVNLCMPRRGTPTSAVNWKEFGFAGSIATRDACEQAGGRWFPQIFNWMVHVYPYETDPDKIWAH
jgi:hypothetical protein